MSYSLDLFRACGANVGENIVRPKNKKMQVD